MNELARGHRKSTIPGIFISPATFEAGLRPRVAFLEFISWGTSVDRTGASFRAQLLMVLYSIRSEVQRMEQFTFNLLYRQAQIRGEALVAG
jgi:hypothetical protein